MQQPSQLHLAALAYAAEGKPVFPCVPGGKSPATPNGFKDATTDPAQIDSWWSQADYNIGICPNDIGCYVVDLDPPAGEQSWSALLAPEGLAEIETLIVRTPRGGRHLWFKGELPTTASRLGPKIDTRGRGGYVLLPPSYSQEFNQHYQQENDREIQTAPAFIGEALKARAEAVSAAHAALDLPAAIERAIVHLASEVGNGRVAVEGSGGNDQTYRTACTILQLGLSPDKATELLLEHWNGHCQPAWDADELEAIVQNAANYAQNEAGAFAVAPAAETFSTALDKLPKHSKPQARARFTLRQIDAIMAMKEPRWLIPGLLQDRSTALLVGITGSYKSFIALDLALSIATASQTFGATPEAGAVVYATSEGLYGMKPRIQSWQLAHADKNPTDFYLVEAPMIMIDTDPQEFGDLIANGLGGKKLKLIILDTTAKAMVGLNENDARDVGRFVRFCDSLVEAFDCCVLAIHHKSDKANASDIRGNSAFRAGFDTYIEVNTNKETKAVAVWARQHKDAEEPIAPWTFEGKKMGPSLIFQPTTQAEHAVLMKDDGDILDRSNVGAALIALGARGEDQAVSSTVLASALDAGASDSQKASLLRRLGRAGRKALAAYCSVDRAGNLAWWMPIAADDK